MIESNPYAAPIVQGERLQPKLPGAKILFASVAAVALTTFGGCWVGVGAGYVGGRIAPSVYSSDESRAVGNAMIIGMGQGLGGGAATGVVLVALFYWYRSRVQRRFQDSR